jgi:flagellar basal body-associated protein FliL
MKSKEKIEIIIAILLILLAAFIMWYYVIRKPSSDNVPNTDQTATTTSTQTLSAYLPNGTATLDTSILTDNKSVFKKLIPPQYPTVSDSEIGNQNLFVPAQ